jgi:hypothetical protein
MAAQAYVLRTVTGFSLRMGTACSIAFAVTRFKDGRDAPKPVTRTNRTTPTRTPLHVRHYDLHFPYGTFF